MRAGIHAGTPTLPSAIANASSQLLPLPLRWNKSRQCMVQTRPSRISPRYSSSPRPCLEAERNHQRAESDHGQHPYPAGERDGTEVVLELGNGVVIIRGEPENQCHVDHCGSRAGPFG